MILELSLPLLKALRCRFTNPLCDCGQSLYTRGTILLMRMCEIDFTVRDRTSICNDSLPLCLQHRHLTEACFAKQYYHTAIRAVKRKENLHYFQHGHGTQIHNGDGVVLTKFLLLAYPFLYCRPDWSYTRKNNLIKHKLRPPSFV